MVDVLHATAHTVVDPTVSNPANAYNGEEFNRATLKEAVVGGYAELTIFGDDYETPDGTCIRDYIHVQDLARAHVLALELIDSGEPFKAFNLGSGSGHSVREVIESVRRVTGRDVPVRVGPRRPGDPPRLVASAQRFQQQAGYAATHDSLEAIVESAHRWRCAHPEGYGETA